MRILVTGASGFIGRRFVARCRAEGRDVVALTRHGGGSPDGGVAAFACPEDLAALGTWDGWPGDVEVVVHLAALNPARGDPRSRDERALMRANADATGVLAQLAARNRVRRFVFISTANVHRAKGGEPVRESDPPAPQNAYAASKLAGETQLREALADFGTDFTILRLPPVYGAGGGGGIAALRRLAALPLPLPLALTRNRRSVLAVENAVDAIHLAMAHPLARDETFLVADDDPRSTGELVRLMRTGLGRRALLFPFPLGFASSLARLGGLAEAADRLLGSFVVDDGRIRERLGWRPVVSTADALARMPAKDGAAA